ncbi:hypothetical protein KEJ21_04890 [Candidatus Bathyarchaeota archaeon]|nr:hypothetical protein [Candidatus Bathyarchaeota archaeon]MBS7631210.1 hypothetical protein [Candidatus Bathyarchaeota archaeon]
MGYDPKIVALDVYKDRRPVEGLVVAVLDITFEKRGLKLIDTKSRALAKHEIHELMITDDQEAEPGRVVDRVSALAFFEIEEGGLAVVGDKMILGENLLGRLAGFDLTHMPNHMNILVKSKSIKSPSIRVGDRVRICR